MHNNDAESSAALRYNHLHESMHDQLVYSDFRSEIKNLVIFHFFLQFLEK